MNAAADDVTTACRLVCVPAYVREMIALARAVASAYTHKTEPLDPHGAFMLGGEQDCFAGCTDPEQGLYGMLDEVRLWRVVRSQEQIAGSMRWASGLENAPGLVGYWKFNDAGECARLLPRGGSDLPGGRSLT